MILSDLNSYISQNLAVVTTLDINLIYKNIKAGLYKKYGILKQFRLPSKCCFMLKYNNIASCKDYSFQNVNVDFKILPDLFWVNILFPK